MSELLAVGAGVTLIVFALVWALCVRINNYGFLDAIWSRCQSIARARRRSTTPLRRSNEVNYWRERSLRASPTRVVTPL